MRDLDVIHKMNMFLCSLSGKLCEWLEKRLPTVTENWWQDLVVNNLNGTQKELASADELHELNSLDLLSILSVTDRNWFTLTSKFYIRNKDRAYIRNLMEIENTWASVSPERITKECITSDIECIKAALQAFDIGTDLLRQLDAFCTEVNDDENLKSAETISNKERFDSRKRQSMREISLGSPVCLKSNPQKIGAVVGKKGNKFTVIIDGVFSDYFSEQLLPLEQDRGTKQESIARVCTALTAYQINNPGSSNLYSLNAARIDFVPYQFRPALKIIKADTPRILVADDVGVGKTIEAGLILKEMEARAYVKSVLIVCPRPLVAEHKWEMEMKRFDEKFVEMDGKALTEAISEMHRDGIWPDRYDKSIIPYSLFGEDMVMGTQSSSDKRKKGIGLTELDPIPHFDLVIVDEAHNIRNPNTWVYKGVELFCRNADAVVFLTATPLQNSTNDLYTLLNLLRPDVVIDKDVFKTMSEPNAYVNNLLRIVRNQEDGWKEASLQEITNILSTSWGRDVLQHNPNFEYIYETLEKQSVDRADRVALISKIESLHSFHTLINRTRRKDIENFCVRRNQTVETAYNPEQQRLYDALMIFESKSLAMLHGSRSVRFMMCTIMRQASSCIYGLAPFMDDILHKRLAQIQEDGELFEFESDDSFDCDDNSSLEDLAREISHLAESLPEEDPKFEKLFEIICQKQTEANNRVIIFSSFRHTLGYINQRLRQRGIRVGQVDGSVPDEERYHLRERFTYDRKDRNAIDVLLFSEVGCEGLDYQFCDTMVNYDLPWNPMRIEQRIGRIDRRGQDSDTVRIYNMITEGTIDATVYYRCLSKIGVFEDSIGDCSEILGDISTQIVAIMFDSSLTEDERKIKIEQMADNEVRKVQELHRMEQEEKALFGFDLSNYIQTKEVQDAENVWISPQSIQALVEQFLSDYLGTGEYIRGKSELKLMRLALDRRQMLTDNLKDVGGLNSNAAAEQWMAYLKAVKPTLSVTFDSLCAKNNRNATFFTQMHPLVMQAAAYESQKLPCELGLCMHSDELPAGDYGFLIYGWKYTGIKPDTKLIVVSGNPMVQNIVLRSMSVCTEYEYDNTEFVEQWENLEQQHYQLWQAAQTEYTKDIQDECQYRLEQLGHSYNKRSAILRDMLTKANDDRISRMRQSQIEKLDVDFSHQKAELTKIINSADIQTGLQVKGVLHIN